MKGRSSLIVVAVVLGCTRPNPEYGLEADSDASGSATAMVAETGGTPGDDGSGGATSGATSGAIPPGSTESSGDGSNDGPGPDSSDDNSGSPCGNGVLDNGEECELGNLGGFTCQSFEYQEGELSCDRSCNFDESRCFTCGNGEIEAAEACDGDAIDGSCEELGYDGGELSCTSECVLDESGCFNEGTGGEGGSTG